MDMFLGDALVATRNLHSVARGLSKLGLISRLTEISLRWVGEQIGWQVVPLAIVRPAFHLAQRAILKGTVGHVLVARSLFAKLDCACAIATRFGGRWRTGPVI